MAEKEKCLRCFMPLEEAYNASPLSKAVREARLGCVLLPEQDAVMIHDTEYTPQPRTKAAAKPVAVKKAAVKAAKKQAHLPLRWREA